MEKSALLRMEVALRSIRNPKFREFLRNALDKAYKGDFADLNLASNYKWFPVDVEEFVEGKYYLNKKGTVYPKVMDELIDMNSGQYVEIVLTGGIGSGKSTAAIYTTAYQLYRLSCLINAHRLFGMDASSEILFIFQSINATLAKQVEYKRFRDMIQASDYFKERFPFDKNLESKMIFPNRIEVVPVSGQETAAIGQNVIGGIIDELNYMSVVEKSKNSVEGGTYDQAIAVYNSIARRRKSRFLNQGALPGVLCLVSSKRYPGQFTDLKEEEAQRELERTGRTSIYVYDKRVWDVKPINLFSEGRFQVFIGDAHRKPRILKPDEAVNPKDRHLVDEVPDDFREDFEKDIINALREIAGKSTLARHPYFTNTEAVFDCMGKVPSFFSSNSVDFVSDQLQVLPKRFYQKDLPRFAHVDLAITGDSLGLAIGTVTGFSNVNKGGDLVEKMPTIRIDATLEIRPPRNGEILFWKMRDIFYLLRNLGLNIRWVTFDSFQSTDSMQLLRQKGFITGMVSMDTSNVPYDMVKTAVYEGRLLLPDHEKLMTEMASLEREPKTGKIDHPPRGSKDIADAVAGVVYGLTMRREIWALYDISPQELPFSIRTAMKAEESRKLTPRGE